MNYSMSYSPVSAVPGTDVVESPTPVVMGTPTSVDVAVVDGDVVSASTTMLIQETTINRPE